MIVLSDCRLTYWLAEELILNTNKHTFTYAYRYKVKMSNVCWVRSNDSLTCEGVLLVASPPELHPPKMKSVNNKIRKVASILLIKVCVYTHSKCKKLSIYDEIFMLCQFEDVDNYSHKKCQQILKLNNGKMHRQWWFNKHNAHQYEGHNKGDIFLCQESTLYQYSNVNISQDIQLIILWFAREKTLSRCKMAS